MMKFKHTLVQDPILNELILTEVDEGLDMSQTLWDTQNREETWAEAEICVIYIKFEANFL